MRLPTNEKDLVQFALRTIEGCRNTQSERSTAYRQYGTWSEAGQDNGQLSLANLLGAHVDRLSSHLYSPSELRFAIDYEALYPKEWLDRANVTARVISREWERLNIDMMFGHAVKEALIYGTCIIKQLGRRDGHGNAVFAGARLVMPWQFGVFDETVNDLSAQEAFVETVALNRHEVWRRIRHLPDAEKRYKRILGSSSKEGNSPPSFMHQVLSTSVLNTTGSGQFNQPGGIVQLSNNANYPMLGPKIAEEVYIMHELWVRDDNRPGEDYTTIQLFEPDVLVAPLLRHSNLFIQDSGVHPYTFVQPNFTAQYAWGRSEITDLMNLQAWLNEHLADAKRLMGQQVDKLLAFSGDSGINEEKYGQFRNQGYIGLEPNAKVEDLTPKMPEQLIPMIQEIINLMNLVSGFSPIMSGQGEPGVRAGVHADTLMKTGSPRIRDRSLWVERQCAMAADVTLSFFEAKEAKAYWTDPAKDESEFLLSQILDDRRISVQTHSASPVFADDHAQLIAWALKSGVIGPEDAIDDLPIPGKEIKRQRLHDREAAKVQLIHDHPEVLLKGHGGGHH